MHEVQDAAALLAAAEELDIYDDSFEDSEKEESQPPANARSPRGARPQSAARKSPDPATQAARALGQN